MGWPTIGASALLGGGIEGLAQHCDVGWCVRCELGIRVGLGAATGGAVAAAQQRHRVIRGMDVGSVSGPWSWCNGRQSITDGIEIE